MKLEMNKFLYYEEIWEFKILSFVTKYMEYND